LADLRAVLRPGAQLAYVVGDQASYLRILIHTGELRSTPAAVESWIGEEERALLSRIQYARLVDIFTGLTGWHIQNHYRSTIVVTQRGWTRKGQVQVDALYLGVDRAGRMYGTPIKAKGAADQDRVNPIQLWQVGQVVTQVFASLTARVLVVKAVGDRSIGMAEFADLGTLDEIRLARLARHRLIPHAERLSPPVTPCQRKPNPAQAQFDV
jgi:hypothetical protein